MLSHQCSPCRELAAADDLAALDGLYGTVTWVYLACGGVHGSMSLCDQALPAVAACSQQHGPDSNSLSISSCGKVSKQHSWLHEEIQKLAVAAVAAVAAAPCAGEQVVLGR